MKHRSFIVCWIFSPVLLHGAFEETLFSANSLALGDAVVAMEGIGAVALNPAALSTIRGVDVVLSQKTIFDLDGLSHRQITAGATGPSKMSWGVGHSAFGGTPYREEETSVFGARSLSDNLGVGLRLKHQRRVQKPFSSKNQVAMDLGGLWRPHPRWRLGLAIQNVDRALWGESTDPAPRLSLGTVWSPGSVTRLLGGVESSADGSIETPLGQAWSPRVFGNVRPFTFRWGLRPQTQRWSLGWGLQHKNIELDYSVRFHPTLGNEHAFSLTWGGFP